MAETPVNPANGVHGLGGDRDTDLQVPQGYRVFRSDKNLDKARQAYPAYKWFVCFSVRDSQGSYANVQYTIFFNRLAPGANLYYFDGTTARPLSYSDAPNKGNSQRSKATLNVGDPPIGAT